MKKILCLLFSMLLSLSVTNNITVLADDNSNPEISVILDGQKLEFDVSPQLINFRTMVPLRKIFESLGTVVTWDNSTQTVTASNEICIVNATINNNVIKINGTPITLDVAPVISNGRTLVPVRAVAEAFGANVEWDSSNYVVTITSYKFPNEDKLSDNDNDDLSDETQMMYTLDGRCKKVPVSQLEFFQKIYWYTEQMQIIYSPDNRNLVIPQRHVKMYEDIGWSTTPPRTVSKQSETKKQSEPTVTMYAADGRILQVKESEVEAHKKVGWYSEPLENLYALDGRQLAVVKSEVDAHKKVGWYDLEGFILNSADLNVQKHGYATAIATLEDYIYRWSNSYIKDESIRLNIENKIIQLSNDWYASIKEPLVVVGWEKSKNSIGTPQISITVRNISGKTITAFETKFTCYDSFGNATTDYPYLYNATFKGYAECENLTAYSENIYTWTLYNNEKTAKISWPYIIRVAFADGSTWYN